MESAAAKDARSDVEDGDARVVRVRVDMMQSVGPAAVVVEIEVRRNKQIPCESKSCHMAGRAVWKE